MAQKRSSLSQIKVKNYYKGEAFHEFLNSALSQRKERNARYSIRSFARLLEIDQSLLTKVLNGQRSLSPETIKRCMEILSTEDNQSAAIPKKIVKKVRYKTLDEEMFEMISEWEYFAILELFTLKDFKGTNASIAKKMGLSSERVVEIMDRMVRLKFFKRLNSYYIPQSGNNSFAPKEKTSEARKKLYKEVLKKSSETLDTIPLEYRDHSLVTLAIKKSELGVFKKTIKDVRAQLVEIFQKSGEFDEVYQLTINLFPLTVLGDSNE